MTPVAHAIRSIRCTMPETPPINVLVVDDLPEKLLVYRSILDEPGLNVVTASSGQEALRRVLHEEFAVILLDVNMPTMDGFETAGFIRARKRSAHTPIIFITAHTDEVYSLRGYAQGAVDYILAPVVPEILRTKVRVFVELFRLNQQVRERAALDIAQARNEQARLAAVLENASDFVGQADAKGRLLRVNNTGRRMIGVGHDHDAPTTLAALYPAWAFRQLAETGMPAAAKDGVWIGDSALLSRDGHEIPVSQVILAHRDEAGSVDLVSIIARDVTERRRAEAVIADSERRYRQLMQALPVAIYTCDTTGRITLYNRAAATLWGREPALGQELWSGSSRMYRPDGSPLLPDQDPMAACIREGRPIHGEEIVIERPDGSRRHVLPNPEPMTDAAGAIVGAVNMLVDVTDLHRTQRALRDRESRLRAMFGQAAVGISLLDPHGRLLEVNERMCQIVGRPAEELCSLTCEHLTHPDDWRIHRGLINEVVSGTRAEFSIEKRYQRGDGEWVWVNVTMSPLVNDRGQVERIIAVIEDIRARKQAEDEVRSHRDRLEDLVRERTAELEASHERLRLADRLASIGTLAAGLGHDLGNLLLPIHMRIDALGRMPLPEEAREDVRAIADACEYLKRLSRGLRLFALNPDTSHASGTQTDLQAWWSDVSPFLRNVLSRGMTLNSDLPAPLPLVRIAPHVLTQMVYNLVQNAADAMKQRASGRVTVSAAYDGGDHVVLAVADDGPGMPAEVAQRCMEPFFTTKTRGISTGLGLALVHGAVRNAGGSVEIESRPGEGTTFRLLLPLAQTVQTVAAPKAEPVNVCVGIENERMRACAAATLRFLGAHPTLDPWSRETRTPIIVLDDPKDRWPELILYLNADSSRRAVVLGGTAPSSVSEQTICLDARPNAADLRKVIANAMQTATPETDGVPA